jgi:glucan phosphoethanolaminetransferase (alkaline phosphatase superfamily)
MNLMLFASLVADKKPTDVTRLDSIKPNFGTFAFTETLVGIAEGLQAVILIVCGIALLVAIATWALGRAFNSQTMQRVTAPALITCAIAAVLTGSAWGIIRWGSGINIMNENNDLISKTASSISVISTQPIL